jgi:hypothetical protein
MHRYPERALGGNADKDENLRLPQLRLLRRSGHFGTSASAPGIQGGNKCPYYARR